MASIQIFFQVLKKHGYPGPEVVDIAQMLNYDLDEFLPELFSQIGEEGVSNFINNTMKKLLGDDMTKTFDVSELCGGPSWVKMKFYDFYYDNENHEDVAKCHAKILDSKITMTDNTETTLEKLWNGADMGEMGEMQEFQDEITYEVCKQIAQQTGFWLVLE